MKKELYFIICIFFFSYFNSSGQISANISKPQIELIDNHVTIHYDILNSNQSDKFNISLEIRDSIGNQINAHTLRGDIGESVGGGKGKEITWDLTVDSVYLEEILYFKVKAKVIEQEKPIEIISHTHSDVAIDVQESSAINNSSDVNELVSKTGNLSRSGVIFSSLLFPGLGLSRINSESPHWLKGVAAYGCIATSLLFNSSANKSYINYQESTNHQARDDYFDTANNQIIVSNAFLISALSIWTIDIIWAITGSKELRKDSRNNWAADLSVQTYSDTEIIAPILSFKYNF